MCLCEYYECVVRIVCVLHVCIDCVCVCVSYVYGVCIMPVCVMVAYAAQRVWLWGTDFKGAS